MITLNLMTDSFSAAGLTDRGVVAIGGAERVPFLQNLVTNDVTRLSPQQALYAGLLTPQGKIAFDFFLVALGDHILLEASVAQVPGLIKQLRLYKLRAKIDIEDWSDRLLAFALAGNGLERSLGLPQDAGAASQTDEGIYFVDPRHKRLGIRSLLRKERAQAALDANRVLPTPPETYKETRMRLGIAEGTELSTFGVYPLEANFEALNGVSFKKGCYVGQELTARMKHKAELRKCVLPVESDRQLPGPGTEIRTGETTLGILLGCARTHGVALIRLDRLAAARARSLPCHANGTLLTIHEGAP